MSKRAVIWSIVGVGVGLAACLACVALAALAIFFPLRRTALPVTGGSDPAPAQPTPGTETGYGAEARQRLDSCNEAFHTFFMLEEAGAGDPTVRPALEQAVEDFRGRCAPLGSLPDAPSRYAQVDEWLKLAAAEVDPAADLLAEALRDQTDLLYGQAAEHLARFIEYIAQADAALSGMEQFKEAAVE